MRKQTGDRAKQTLFYLKQEDIGYRGRNQISKEENIPLIENIKNCIYLSVTFFHQNNNNNNIILINQ